MLGLGETRDEVLGVMRDLRAHNVDILTLGQYLRPSPKHLPIIRYATPEEFAEYSPRGARDGVRARRSRPAGAQFLSRRGGRVWSRDLGHPRGDGVGQASTPAAGLQTRARDSTSQMYLYDIAELFCRSD